VLLVGLLFQFLIPALKISNRITLKAEVQQQATIALRNLVGEIEQASLFGLSFSTDSRVVAIHPIVEVTRNSQRVYADHIIVYKFDPASRRLSRYTWRNGLDPSIEAPRKLDDTELDNVEAHFIDAGRTVAREVDGFQLTHSGTGNLIQQPLLVKMTMRQQTASGNDTFELVRAVSLRNQS
jgi:hypothetical protein